MLSISEKLDEKEQKAQAYVVLAWSYYKGRDYEQSKTYGQKFLSISQKLGEPEQEAKAYKPFTQSYCEEKDKAYGLEFLSISKELKERKKQAKACDFLVSHVMKKETMNKAKHTARNC